MHLHKQRMFVSVGTVLSLDFRPYLRHDQGEHYILHRLTVHAMGMIITFFVLLVRLMDIWKNDALNEM